MESLEDGMSTDDDVGETASLSAWAFHWEKLLRPTRLVVPYTQGIPFRAQRAQVGFSLGHLSLEFAQASQLSLSLGREGSFVDEECERELVEVAPGDIMAGYGERK